MDQVPPGANASKGVYRLTPDLKLVARISEHVKGQQLVVESRKVLADLARATSADCRGC